MELRQKSIAVIGGGAAGMMAAISAKETAGDNAEVILFEKNMHLGAKVLISGGGRCNVTTGLTDVKKVLENYPRGGKFLTKAMYHFGPREMMGLLEERGVKLKMEDDLRVFPVSNDGHEVVAALERSLKHFGVKVFCSAMIKEIAREDGGFLVRLVSGREFSVDKVVLTTGGSAYRSTGSSGDGYDFAHRLGHKITPLAPSLSSIVMEETYGAALAGVSFKRVEVSLVSGDGKRIYKRTGSLVFTHQGVSGPVVFALSAMAAYEPEEKMKVVINFFPDEKPEQLKNRFDGLMQVHGKKQLLGILDMLLPRSLAEVMVENSGIARDLHAARIGREDRRKILDMLIKFTLNVKQRSAGDEFVTAGGVSLDEVDSSTMESKICPGLYFAGEVLDIDGFTGGFNLQAAWATGRLAGESSARN